MAGRELKYGSNMGIFILMVLGILVVGNLFSSKYFQRFDLTETKKHSLAPQSVKIMSTLDQPVRAYAFFGGEQFQQKEASDLLEEFAHHSSQFDFESVDLDKKPGLAKKFEVKRYGTVVLEGNDKQEKISRLDEEKLVNAILKVISDEEKVVYFVTGHGERNLNDSGPKGYDGLKVAVEKENYTVKDLLLVSEGAVPKDATVLVVAGPTAELLPGERSLLDQFVRAGGRVIYLVDPFTLPDTGEFLNQYGVQLTADVVVDTHQAKTLLVGEDPLLTAVTEYGTHPITKEFNVMSLFSLSRSVTPSENPPEKVKVEKLASSSQSSWSETNLELFEKGQVGYNENKDRIGPITVAVVAEITVENPDTAEQSQTKPIPAEQAFTEGRVVVFGDSDFLDNGHLNFSGNRDLFLNTVNWLAEDESRISIRAKNPKFEPFMFSPAQARVIFWVPVVVLPLLVGMVGVVVNVRRMRG